ncbi:MAG: ADP-ribosylglycohydrolase family protein [Ignavibacteriales bacterium]|nr:ADP-ribosylglycohydrolase family protein [Ignavibacteriales bacterium]
MTLQEKARGAFVGLAVGDALGSPTEGKTPEEISSRWGRVNDFLSADQGGSDDTEYALFSAKLLLQHKRELTSAIVADAYRRDIINAANAYKGAGFSEMIAINNISKGLQPPQSGQHVHSWSDGLAMRVVPYGIAAAGDPHLAAHFAREDGLVANAGEGIYAGQAVAAAIAAALSSDSLDQIAHDALEVIPNDSWTASSIEQGLSIGRSAADVWSSLKPLHSSIACSYYFWPDVAPEAVGLAFGIIAAARGKFEDAVLGAVNLGRDTDTIAGIAGAICGAMQGIQAIPDRWTKRISIARGTCINAVKGMDIISVADDLNVLAQSWSKP